MGETLERKMEVPKASINKKTTKVALQSKRESPKEKPSRKDYSYLLEKADMTDKDKANMKKCVKSLIDKKMDTPENLNKLDAIVYGSNYIEIASLKFSREKFAPNVEFNKMPNQQNIFESNEKGIYKTYYNGNREYFLTTQQYIAQTQKQGVTGIQQHDIEKALQALPGTYSDENWYVGGNILGDILGLSPSGYVKPNGERWDESRGGYLASATQAENDDPRIYEFQKDGGALGNHYNKEYAYPCLSLIA